MAKKKIQIRPKGTGDYADILYPETSAEQVIANSGKTLEEILLIILTTANRGTSNGVAPLDANSKIPPEYMPTNTSIEPRTTDPLTPANGRIWLRTDL